MYVVIEYSRWNRGETEAPAVKGSHEFVPGVRIARDAPQQGVTTNGTYWHEDEAVFEGSSAECGIYAAQLSPSAARRYIQPLLDLVEASPEIRDLGGFSPRWGRTHSYRGEMRAEWAGRVWTIRGERANFSEDMEFRVGDGAIYFESDRGEQFSI